MAVRTVSNTGGNWNATTTWVGGVVPSTTLDTVAFTATSGQLTVNVASTCIGIDFTNYVNTITFTAGLIINGPVNLGTGGYTQAGASGISVTTTSTLTSGGVTWSRLWTFAGTSQTYTMSGTWTFTGTLNFSPTTSMTLTGSTINTRNLTHTTTATIAGTTAIVFNGTGTWSHTLTGVIQNNVTINTTGVLTIGASIYYNTGTLTYTPNTGSVVTTGSLLTVSTNTTLNTNTLNWNNVNFVPAASTTITITLTSDFNVLGTLSEVQATGTIIINGLFNINASGSLSTTAIVSGTATHVLKGTGTLSTGNFFRTSLTINTAGTITISGTFYFATGTLTHITGTVVFSSTILYLNLSPTLNTSNLTWPTVYINGTSTLTLLSDFKVNDFTINQGIITWITGGYILTINNDLTIGGTTYPSIGGIITLSIPNDIYVKNLVLNSTSANSTTFYQTTVNGSTIYVQNNLTVGNWGFVSAPIIGTTNIVIVGTCLFTMNGQTPSFAVLNNNLIFNTGGTITLGSNIYYNTGTLTYLNGKVIAKNYTFTLNLATTLINCHKINFDKVVIASGVTITMNEFFSGSPNLKTTISSSTITNYTITFQDGFEKITKFVNISGCTLSKPQQLLVVTNSKKNSTNTRGIRYINQSPNGISKGKPSTPTQVTYNSNTSMLLSDPAMR